MLLDVQGGSFSGILGGNCYDNAISNLECLNLLRLIKCNNNPRPFLCSDLSVYRPNSVLCGRELILKNFQLSGIVILLGYKSLLSSLPAFSGFFNSHSGSVGELIASFHNQ